MPEMQLSHRLHDVTVVMAFLTTLFVAAATTPAQAAITSIQPASPTSQDVIRATITFSNPGCVPFVTTTVNGLRIRTDIALNGCALTPPAPDSVIAAFGPLAGGTYEYEVYTTIVSPGLLNDRQTIVVADPPTPVPVLGFGALVAMLVAIVAVALLRLR